MSPPSVSVVVTVYHNAESLLELSHWITAALDLELARFELIPGR